jgi:hypothetical protein
MVEDIDLIIAFKITSNDNFLAQVNWATVLKNAPILRCTNKTSQDLTRRWTVGRYMLGPVRNRSMTQAHQW